MTIKPALNVALVEVGDEHRQVFKEACAAAGYSPIFKTTPDVCTDGLGPWADVVVVESDLGFRAPHSVQKARRCGRCPVCMLVNWWSDLERDASEAADFVIHVPLTADEICHVLVSAVPMRPGGAERSGRCAGIVQGWFPRLGKERVRVLGLDEGDIQESDANRR